MSEVIQFSTKTKIDENTEDDEDKSINVEDVIKYLLEVDFKNILIIGMDGEGMVNRYWKNMGYESMIYHLQRTQHQLMKDIDNINEN